MTTAVLWKTTTEQERWTVQYNKNENKYSVTKEFATFAFRIHLAGKCWVANSHFLKSHYQPITNNYAQFGATMLPPPSYWNQYTHQYGTDFSVQNTCRISRYHSGSGLRFKEAGMCMPYRLVKGQRHFGGT